MPYRRLNTPGGACACDKTVPSTVIYYFYSFIYRIKYYERSRYIIKNVRFLWSTAFHPPRYRAPFLNHIVSRFPSLPFPVESCFKQNFNPSTTFTRRAIPRLSRVWSYLVPSNSIVRINSLRVVKTFRCCAHVFVALSLESKQHDSRRKSENAIITALPLIAPTYYSTGFIESRHRGAKDSWW